MRVLLFPNLLLRAGIVLVAILIAVYSQWGAAPSTAHFADAWLRDCFIRLQAVDTPQARILLVDIDETSLARYPWPWPRARLAELTENLLASGARGVALDILQEKPADAGGDRRIAMLAQHGPVVLAQLFDYGERAQALRGGLLAGGWLARGAPDQDVTQAAPAHGFIANHAGLALAAHVGNIGIVPDPDGVVRHVPMLSEDEPTSTRRPAISPGATA